MKFGEILKHTSCNFLAFLMVSMMLVSTGFAQLIENLETRGPTQKVDVKYSKCMPTSFFDRKIDQSSKVCFEAEIISGPESIESYIGNTVFFDGLFILNEQHDKGLIKSIDFESYQNFCNSMITNGLDFLKCSIEDREVLKHHTPFINLPIHLPNQELAILSHQGFYSQKSEDIRQLDWFDNHQETGYVYVNISSLKKAIDQNIKYSFKSDFPDLIAYGYEDKSQFYAFNSQLEKFHPVASTARTAKTAYEITRALAITYGLIRKINQNGNSRYQTLILDINDLDLNAFIENILKNSENDINLKKTVQNMLESPEHEELRFNRINTLEKKFEAYNDFDEHLSGTGENDYCLAGASKVYNLCQSSRLQNLKFKENGSVINELKKRYGAHPLLVRFLETLAEKWKYDDVCSALKYSFLNPCRIAVSEYGSQYRVKNCGVGTYVCQTVALGFAPLTKSLPEHFYFSDFLSFKGFYACIGVESSTP